MTQTARPSVATATSDSSLPPRGALRLIFDPVFGTIFWGKLLSVGGVWVHSIVSAIVVYQATGSTLLVGLVSAGQVMPQLMLTPLSGKLADRGHAAAQILVGRLVCAIGSGALAIWFLLVDPGKGFLGAVPVLISSLILGVGFTIGGPALQSIIPSIVRPGELSIAMALNTAPLTAARVGGPALGAFVVVHMGPAAAFALAGALHLFFVAMMIVVRIPSPHVDLEGADMSVRASLRYVWRDRPLFILLMGITAVGFGVEPTVTLSPAIVDAIGEGPEFIGILLAVFGIGATGGLVFHGWIHRRASPATVATTGLALMTVGLAAPALVQTHAVLLIAFALTGLGFSSATSSIGTLVQERSPDAYRGRIMALWLVGFVAARPLAAALDGTLADHVSVDAALLATAAILAVCTYACRPSKIGAPRR
ncbi:MAG: entS 3 [Nocardioidaceae bacterium]|nr:entS 3 [Nocardioidaceae bacterium]